MNTRIAATVSVLVALTAVSHAYDFFTFSDNSFTSLTRTVSGTDGYGDVLYTLTTPTGGAGLYTTGKSYGTNFSGRSIKFQLDAPLTFVGTPYDVQDGTLDSSGGISGPGSLTFTENGVTLLKVSFDKAVLDATGFHASYNDGVTGVDDLVRFSGPLAPVVTPQQAFSFPVTNLIPSSNGNVIAMSSAFSATGSRTQAVPEPTTLAALGLGGLALLRRRRRA